MSKLEFGDQITNLGASENNPDRQSYYVQSYGKDHRVTDGKGRTWLLSGRAPLKVDLLAKPITDAEFRAALASTEAEAVDDWAELPGAVAAQDYLDLARKLGSCPAAHALVDAAERIGLRRG